MVKVILHGCNGKMGRMITGICKEDDGVEIVAGIDVFDGVENTYPVFSQITDCEVPADVIVDFTNAGAVDALLSYSADKKLPLVLCSTGLSEEQLAGVQKTAERTAILKSANMSLGVNTLIDLLKKAASVFAPAGFDIEIVEKHHNQKLDAPSGTALALADAVNEALPDTYTYTYDRSGRRQKTKETQCKRQAVSHGMGKPWQEQTQNGARCGVYVAGGCHFTVDVYVYPRI